MRPTVTTPQPPAPAPETTELPPTGAGAAARAWLAAVNSGDEARLHSTLEQSLSASALSLAPLGEWLNHCKDLAQSSGGLDVARVEAAASVPELVRFHVRARKLERHALVSLRVDGDGKIVDLDLRPEHDPTSPEARPLAPVAMPEDELVRAIEHRLARLAATERFAGAVLITRGPRVLVSAAHGLAERSFGAPIRLDTRFNLGSMNKMFTAVAIAQLVEAGKLSFDDTLEKLLPDYPNQAFARTATIHRLLTHSSGIGGTIFPPALFERRDRFRRAADYLPLFADEPPQFEPGARFSYANPGYMVLGLVIERVSGEPYDDYMRDHVFAPAGMGATAAHAWDEVIPNLAVGYARDPADPLGVRPLRSNISTLPFQGSPAGGGYSTVIDLLAFADALRDRRLVGAAMLETLTTAKIDTPWTDPVRRYGYGFMIHEFAGKPIFGHGGGAPGINGELQIFADGSYTVAVLGNLDYPNAVDVAYELTELLAAQPTEPRTPAASGEPGDV